MKQVPLLFWFRQSLRLHNNPALSSALKQEQPIIPIFIWSPKIETPWAPGEASQWWLHHSLQALNEELISRKSQLLIFHGEAPHILLNLARETDASALYYDKRIEPFARKEEEAVTQKLEHAGLLIHGFFNNLLFDPASIQNKSGKPYQVFTPFWKAVQPFIPLVKSIDDLPREFPTPPQWPASFSLKALNLLPSIPWTETIAQQWRPGETEATRALTSFVEHHALFYGEHRDRPDQKGVSCLSPYLHFGEISPQQIVTQVLDTFPEDEDRNTIFHQYIRQLIWREFAHHLLFHFPNTPDTPLRPEFVHFPWEENSQYLKAWQRGKTGYPLVDAGMRELWATGWMHNRVRMVVGSFLVKHLLIPWQAGAAWFWNTLVDADLANNTMGWQWIGGCGADAAPYFRVFNPITQGEKFDPEGTYIRKWVPELARLETPWIHRPWEAPPLILHEAEVQLGSTYPPPIIDHGEGRRRALVAYDTLKQRREKLLSKH